MVTKTTKTTKTADDGGELDRLRALLAAAHAERDNLAAKLATKTARATNPRRAAWMAEPTGEDFTAPADTVMGKAQRQSREELCYTIQKVFRMIPNRELPKLLADLTERACKDGGMDGETVADTMLVEAMTRTKRGPRTKAGDSPAE